MALDFNQRSFSKTTDQSVIDEGLRAYMLKVYNYMTTGLLFTGLVAYFFGKASIVTNDFGQIIGVTSIGAMLFGSPLKWVVMLAPLGFVFYLSARINKMNISTAQITFWIFSAIMGLSLASLFIEFTQSSIARVFFITSGTFAAMSLYGYTTKRDLTRLGGFLFMGLIGIIIASVVNIFIGSSALQFAISVIGVLVFVGLTAYDTQSIKNMYYSGDSEDVGSKKALMGALRLYLDFINLFILLLQLFGQRR
ncbi:MAG: Inner membrane protein YbhL [Alphaproteobacteria bacterium MarineAlpha5_Bin8]|nr:MAG: Inner membrane protein YbhL [Alphaproteobacteria bacterium MarineAlpha5_Bin7]PPR46987.1 MAG: Inner membrane protein YbhL [Alphaproteobacteria bacterium MarineAlpha5_Bin8]PPR54927.1 MAG: Inner membrane protein YbhL [Alphaproteobacteria bacterium MarineAlpha5_Bin6]|tara:strand:+ start:731 stop:1483 length:753 start_codon:yes stop_codon:yes gene_type:complete